MLRKFTQAIGRYKVGQQHDYPLDVWNKLEKEAGKPLKSFTELIESNAILQSSLKRRPVIHTRAGATA